MKKLLDKFSPTAADIDAKLKEERRQQKEERLRLSRRSRGIERIPVAGKIDLHNYTEREAWEVLSAYITSALTGPVQRILVIHGRGNHSQGKPVLKSVVERLSQCDDRVTSLRKASPQEGAEGATWMILRDPYRSR